LGDRTFGDVPDAVVEEVADQSPFDAPLAHVLLQARVECAAPRLDRRLVQLGLTLALPAGALFRVRVAVGGGRATPFEVVVFADLCRAGFAA
jgi:hypothetical protein